MLKKTIALATVAILLSACESVPATEGLVAKGGGDESATVGIAAHTSSGTRVSVQFEGRVLPSGIHQYLAIPFAEPPVGDLRFRHAVAKNHAHPRIQKAQRYPSACPQDQGNPKWYRDVAENFGASRDSIADQTSISEDCLYLNIWAPPLTGKRRAVMVWFHGGSNVNGWSYEPNYLGHVLAEQDVVVVSVQSRLGPFGFLPFVLDPKNESNFALSDQVEALRWIRHYIAAFGGDPDNVTAFGESAGGGNIAALLSGSAAQGLFHKAIIQSGGSGAQVAVSQEVAGTQARAMFEAMSVTSARQARKRPWQDYLDWVEQDESGYYHYPVVDNVFVRAQGSSRGGSADLLIGTNRHEMLMYLDATSSRPLADVVASTEASPSLVALVKSYAQEYQWSGIETAGFLSSLNSFHCPALWLANRSAQEGNRIYLYTFTRVREQDTGIGAYHGAEIPYVFDTHDDWLPTNEIDRSLTRVMATYWSNFAKTANPNSQDVQHWQAYTPAHPYTQELGNRVGEYDNLFIKACELLWRDTQP